MTTAQVETITPAAAAQLLANMAEGQRRLRQKHVDSLAIDMANGKWFESASSIIIDGAGKLLDGQHRLNAVIKAGVPVRMLVVRQADSDAFKVIDSGAKRQIADRAHVSSPAAAAGRTMTAWLAGVPVKTILRKTRYSEYAITDQIITDFILENRGEIEQLTAAYLRVRNSVKRLSIRSFAIVYMAAKRAGRLEDFHYLFDEVGKWDSAEKAAMAIRLSLNMDNPKRTLYQQLQVMANGLGQYMTGIEPKGSIRAVDTKWVTEWVAPPRKEAGRDGR